MKTSSELTKTEKMQFILTHWKTMSITELSDALGVPPMTISQWASRARKRGIKGLAPKKRVAGKINWASLQKEHKQ